MIENGTDDKIHALDVTDLRVVDSVLGEDLFGNLGLLNWVDFLWK
jgi:hypothetical protein